MREKLIKLLCEAHNISTEAACFEDMTYAGQLRMEADYLIANGVTFATDNNVGGWIPVTERLPEKDGHYIVRTTTGAVTTARFYMGKTYPPTHYRPTEYHSPTKWQSNRNVTHWMPMPEPPKGE